ncbi:MAG: tRNA dihydrouridine synthase DusB [Ruminococcus sp.]|nr:tRNA dihydrouridine synthase DusB [Ruminococcus sp.]
MKIGNIELKSGFFLAPLAGITDMAFRQMCKRFGAAYSETEMVSAKALSFGDKKSFELMKIASDEHPCGIQLFGSEPEIIASSAKVAVEAGADIIDINMGCPAPKVANNGSGSALMKKPALCGEIVGAVKKSVNVPVTVKIRKGFDKDNPNAVEVAKICEQNGADAVIVHGRTRDQYYSGQCDLDIIRSVKENVRVPVIGNGDVRDIKSAQRMLEHTGCDAVMIARAALGNPWIFTYFTEYFDKGTITPELSSRDKLQIMREHIELVVSYKGEYMGMLQSRKQIAWYLKGFKGAAKFRNEAGRLSTLNDMYDLIERVLESNQ